MEEGFWVLQFLFDGVGGGIGDVALVAFGAFMEGGFEVFDLGDEVEGFALVGVSFCSELFDLEGEVAVQFGHCSVRPFVGGFSVGDAGEFGFPSCDVEIREWGCGDFLQLGQDLARAFVGD